MTRGGGPKAFGDDDKLWFLPGLNQAVGILMMGKVGAAGPPDKANIGEAPRHAVVLIPVSYTHLDVYKRQGLSSAPP